MKKLLVILFSVGLALGASAQRGHVIGHGGGGYVYSPRVVVGVGLGYGYGFGYGPYYPWGLGMYGPWGYPYPPYYYGQGAMPSRLALQISSIKNDYQTQIKSTRHDKTIPRSERRQRIRQLKHDRDQAIINARKDFYYNSRKNYNNRQNQNGPGNGSNNNGSNGNGSNGNGSNGNGSSQNDNNGSNKDNSPYSN